MTDTPCPQQNELLQYLSGKLDEQQAESFAVHIDTCAICNETVSTLNPGPDPLVSELKEAASPSFSAEPECDAAISALAELPSISSAKKPAGPKSPFALPKTIREYRLTEQIGRGGMGAVFKAEHVRLKRLVAVKVLLGDRLHDDSAVARFDREMEAVGKLDHPNIVRATDAGEDEETHYLVMELIDGPNLSQIAKSLGPIGVANACELVRQAAEGLQHAHEHGLVHRDIKPSNLILADTRPSSVQSAATSAGSKAMVKILDLGLALLRENPTAEGELTSSGQVMGTLDYMAPEQASDTHSVDIRADIYSLGCTLYHLLAGSAPFSGSQYSTVLKKMMAHAKSPVPSLNSARSDISAELTTVLDRMLAKEPNERFATPAEVAAALQSFTSDANLPGLLDRVHAANADVEHLETQLQSTVNPMSSALSDTIDPAAKPVSDSSEPADVSASPLQPAAEQPIAEVAAEPFAPTIIVDRTPQSLATNRGSGGNRRRRVWQLMAGFGGVLLLGIVFFVGTGEGRVELTVNHRDIQVSVDGEPQQIKVLDGATGEYRIELPNVPAGRRELIVTRDGFAAETRHFWITRNGSRAFEMKLAPKTPGSDIGSTVAAANSHPKKASVENNLGPAENILPGLIPRPATILGIKRWNLESRAVRTDIHELAASPDGELLACGTRGGRVKLFDCGTSELVKVFAESHSPVIAMEWSPDSQLLATCHMNAGIVVWSRDGRTAWSQDCGVHDCAWAKNGNILAASESGVIRFWTKNGEPQKSIFAAGHGLSSISVAPDGKDFVTGSSKGKLSLWNRDEGLVATHHAHEGRIGVVAWSPAGNIIASGGDDGQVCFWSDEGKLLSAESVHRATVNDLAWNSSGTPLLSVSMEGTICEWTVSGELVRTDRNAASRNPQAIEWSADTTTFVVGGAARDITRFARDAGVESRLPGFDGEIRDARWDGKGTRFATSARDSLVRVHTKAGEPRFHFAEDQGGNSISWSPDDSQIASTSNNSDVAVWNVERQQRERTLRMPGPVSVQYSLDWNPKNGDVAVARSDGKVTIWKTDRPQSVESRQHRGAANEVRWIPGTDLLASIGANGDFQLGPPGQEPLRPDSEARIIRGLACSGDGKSIATLDPAASHLEIWSSDGQLQTSKQFPTGSFRSGLGWTKDGEHLILTSFDGELIRIDRAAQVLTTRPMHHSVSEVMAIHPTEDFGISADNAGTIIKWSTENLEPEWVIVNMPESESLQFSASGELQRGDRELFEREFVYVIEDETGQRHLLTPSEFDQRRSLPGDFSVDDAHADRRFAQWVLDRGGKLIETGTEINAPLPKGQKLKSIRIFMTGEHIGDAEIRKLVEIIPKGITWFELQLTDTKATSASFKDISSIPALTALLMRRATISPSELLHLRSRTLKQLSLIDVRLTEAADGRFDWSGIPNLQSIQIGTQKGSPDFNFNDGSLNEIGAAFRQLNNLWLWRSTITDDGLDALARFPNLESLALPISSVSDHGIPTIVKNHPLLATLDLNGSLVTGTGLSQLGSLKHLERVSLADCPKISTSGFAELAKISSLESLTVTTTNFGDDEIQSLHNLPNLAELIAKHTKITDQGLTRLAALRALRKIDLYGCPVTVEGVAHLQQALPECDVVSNFTDDDILTAMGPEGQNRRFAQWVLDRGGKLIQIWGDHPELKSAESAANCEGRFRVEFRGRPDIGDSDLETMRRLRPSRQIDLWIIDCPAVTSAGIRHLQGFDIVSLNLAGTSIDDDAAETLAGFKNLDALHLTKTKMTSACFKRVMSIDSLRTFHTSGINVRAAELVDLKHSRLTALSMVELKADAVQLDFLSDLPALKALQLGFRSPERTSPIRDEDLRALAKLKSLEDLMLMGTSISDDGIQHLSQATRLHSLKLLKSQVTDVGLRELITDHPNLTSLAIDGSRVTNDGLLQVLKLKKLTSLAISECKEIDSVGFEAIGRATRLEYLFADATSFSDTDLQALSGLKSLNHLGIRDTLVTGAGIETLSRFKSLRVLNITRTNITPDGVTRLRSALPDCEIRVY